MTIDNARMKATPFGRRMRWAGLAIILGLIIQLASLSVTNPVTFMLFLGPGVVLVLFGAAFFLWAVFTQSQLGWNKFAADSPSQTGAGQPRVVASTSDSAASEKRAAR